MSNTASQTTSNILMVRPASFGFNDQTADSNGFQQRTELPEVAQQALKEFDGFVRLLRSHGVNVTVVNDTAEPHKPDAIFPNNWVSFHSNGDVIIYPMQAQNRRWERNEAAIRGLEGQFKVDHIIDLSRFELEEKFLEGTGSMVLDRENRIAYACLSPRTHADVLNGFCNYMDYEPMTFHSLDSKGKAIYHTNVMMCLGSRYAVICLESIADEKERQQVIESLQKTGKEIIDITYEQMDHFAGNMLEIQNNAGKSLLVMSASAKASLTDEQLNTLQTYSEIVSPDIRTIETIGGGSARCMIAEIHLPLIK
ncbi:amidinotransferase [Mucilaginibacter daejeonensis]|uniref:citrulline utilization hydrolase CtlX n=1 Tax=Mucilaginibacter daejeonensis TaxID=398049 RepID=UPI001D17513F|nr:arginine deiminase-related protein [Mucilaginibacter daejeonensis]UEG51955.1 amidinotransferase [Mucilaginibacter daejeonensis]